VVEQWLLTHRANIVHSLFSPRWRERINPLADALIQTFQIHLDGKMIKAHLMSLNSLVGLGKRKLCETENTFIFGNDAGSMGKRREFIWDVAHNESNNSECHASVSFAGERR